MGGPKAAARPAEHDWRQARDALVAYAGAHDGVYGKEADALARRLGGAAMVVSLKCVRRASP